MSELQTFFDMGGYAAYVWPAYGISILGLTVLALVSWREMKRAERLVDLNDKAAGRD